ncbi:MAG: hypothetical protein H6707_20020 [Deltaproteobacteria bacterium]|nr:hypothetical protein [Deltaproteobacteria bacterium]
MLCPLALVVLALVLSVCRPQPPALVLLELSFAPTVTIDQLELTTFVESDSTTRRGQRFPEQPAAAPLISGQRVAVLLPEAWIGQSIGIDVEGYRQGQLVARGAVSIVLERAGSNSARVLLGEPCRDACTVGVDECVGDQRRSCHRDEKSGCTTWAPPVSCPKAQPFCSAGKCADRCSDECVRGKDLCVDNKLARCGDYDSDSCADRQVADCPANQICDALAGACVPSCAGKPCACKTGETAPCADVGVCKGGKRSCTAAGTWGPCVYASGATAKVCDGLDNDCDGKVDDGLVAEGCAKQHGVCAGAVKSCGGQQGWLGCDDATYIAHAKSRGLVYEQDETACDGQDNDCDGQVDEAAACCQPDCTNKTCGASDGCGGTCMTGRCPSNQTCTAGTCLCNLRCGSDCCAAGTTCFSGACCTPDCSNKACGADDGCGGTCPTGSCADPLQACTSGRCGCLHQACLSGCCDRHEYCASSGCVATSCQTLPLDTRAPAFDLRPVLARDSKGKAHIAYARTGGGLGYATNLGGSFSATLIDSDVNSGDYPALAIDANDKVHVVHRGGLYNKRQLIHTTNAGGAWVNQPINAPGEGARWPDLVIDDRGKLHVVFEAEVSTHRLRYATNASGSWVVSPVDTGAGDSGIAPALALDSNRQPHIIHADVNKKTVRYTRKSSGGWVSTALSGVEARQGWLALDDQDKAHVVLCDETAASYPKSTYVTNASGNWSKQVIAGLCSILRYDGQIAFDGAGRVHVGIGRPLRHLTRENGSWRVQTVDAASASVGGYLSMALASDGRASFAYDVGRYAPFSGELLYAADCPP